MDDEPATALGPVPEMIVVPDAESCTVRATLPAVKLSTEIAL